MNDPKPACSMDGCTSPTLARGWCSAHYQRWRATGTPEGHKRPRATCQVADCDRPAEAWGLCPTHVSRLRRTGSTEDYEPVITRFDLFVHMRGEQDCWEWLGPRNNRGYGTVGHQYAHRVACERAHGPAPEGQPFALHSCDNPPCVNPAHLRWGTPSANQLDRWARTGRRRSA